AMFPILALLLSTQLTEARVSFTSATIYGEYDLNGYTKIGLDACGRDGCSVYVSAPLFSLDATKNLFVIGNDGTNVSLYSLATQYDQSTSEKIGLHLNSSGYSIANNNKDDVGSIVIYVVAANAPFYGSDQVQIYDASNVNKRPFSNNSMTMIMSAEPFNVFVQADTNVKAFVRATGFDNNSKRGSTDQCNIIYDHTTGKAFRLRINSPMVTINTDGLSNYQICAKVEDVNGALLDYPGMATSKGYIGCAANNYQNYRSSLYSNDTVFEVKDSQNKERSTDLTYTVLTKQADKLTIKTFKTTGISSFSVSTNVAKTYNRTEIAYKMTVDMPINYGSSVWVGYSPKNPTIPSGQGICGEFYQTTTTTARTTTSGANGFFTALLPLTIFSLFSMLFESHH
ncbi:hypothetical protein PMAYCL1PPCAC_23201, partial [Pristionchus mayeri]